MIIQFSADYPVECLLSAEVIINNDDHTKAAKSIGSLNEDPQSYVNLFTLDKLNMDVNDGIWRIVNHNRNEFFPSTSKVEIDKSGPVPKVRVNTRMCVISHTDMAQILRNLQELKKFPGGSVIVDDITRIFQKDGADLKFED